MDTELNNRFSSHFLPPADSHLILVIIARLSTLIIYYSLCCIVGDSQGNFEINQRSAKHTGKREEKLWQEHMNFHRLSSLCVSHKWWLASEHSFFTYLTWKQKTVVCFFAQQESLVFTIRDWDITELSSRLGWELFNYLQKCLKHVNTPP